MKMSVKVLAFSLGARRRVLLSFYAVMLLVVVSATTSAVIFILSRRHILLADRTAEMGDVLAGSTLLLAFIAALIALHAYAAATGLPDLRLQLLFNYSDKNYPVFRAICNEDGRLQTVGPIGQTTATVLVSNVGSYSGRNPAIMIRLNAMLCDSPNPATGWATVEAAEGNNAVAVQWDGGATYSIHGHSIRYLPALNLGCLKYVPEWGVPSLSIEILAEGGYRREISLPVCFITAGRSVPSKVQSEDKPTKEWL
jgi:hypothetical protein